MKLQQNQCSVTKIIPYKDAVISFLKQPVNEETDKFSSTNHTTLGGVLSDVNYTWLSNGPRLEVLSTKTGSKIAAWTFGAVLRDYYTKVTCVDSFSPGNSNGPVLVVGLQSGLTRGMICVFDVQSSKVLRAIQLDKQISSIHVVDAGCGANLPGPLHALDGILAVGTNEGKILLIDLCRQACDEAISNSNSDYIRNEITACDFIPLPLQELPNLEKHKEMSLKTGNHLCLQLNENCTLDNLHVKGPRGETVLRVNIVEAKISALHYSTQLGTLFIGYNFGVYQMYNLLAMKLEFTSQTHEGYIPVSHFAIQEPSDDPRAFCYVWVMYSNTEVGIPGFPVSVLFALHYNTKEFLEGYGNLYQDFTSCSLRFQTDLIALPGSKINKPIGANCLSLTSYTKSNQKQMNCHLQETADDSIALCAVVWSVWNNVEAETYMCLFDLNQWYKEQMPANPSDDNSSYMVFLNLKELFDTSTQKNSVLLDVKIDPKNVSQFTCAQRLEEHYHPSSLAYKFVCTREEDIIWVDCPGVQRHLLSCIELAGPLCLLRPSDIFLQCVSLGLTPLYTDVIYNAHTPISLQREMILSVALEHQLISWLCHCAQEWSNGSQSSYGCTLDFLLNWAWQRANVLKQSGSEICEPLFDYSGERLDQNAHLQLNHCAKQLKHLSSLYGHVINFCLRFLSEESCNEINHQYKALQMLSVYLEVLQWLLNVGLLPECPLYMYPRPDETERISAPYPVDSLVRFYKDRRANLFELQGAVNIKENQSCDLLFIDNLIDIECGGETLHDEWKEDGGTGLYPPPSLQALLRTYLIEDVDIEIKHCIFIYVFLDLAMTLDQSRYTPIITHLIKFPAVFKISPSVIKITQAFWQLDHGDFSTAMPHLLDRLVSNEDLQPWHHRIAVKALLAQGQHQHALLYHQVRQPPVIDLQDLCITTTLLIFNDLFPEAFHFQRQNRSECNEKELLQHFMEACDKTNQLVHILQLPLGEAEEEALVKYLEENRREDNEDFLVKYYIQRSRYAEAHENNDKLNAGDIGKQGLIGQSQERSRTKLIQRNDNNLPIIARDILGHFSAQKRAKGSHFRWTNVDRPVPMSVYVHENHNDTLYKSSFINTSLIKARETWSMSSKLSKEIPFLSTPKRIEPKKQSSTPIIYPMVVSSNLSAVEENVEEPVPAKRRRLGSRQPISPKKDKVQKTHVVSAKAILKTPIVKRKKVRARFTSSSQMLDSFNIGSPQSILKVRKLVRQSISPIERGNSTTPENLDEIDDLQPIDKTAAEKIKSSFIDLTNYSVSSPGRLTPRKIIQRTPKQGVRFEDSRPLTTSDDEKMEVYTIPINTSNILERSSDLCPDSSEEHYYSPINSSSEIKTTETSTQNSPVIKEIPIIIEEEKITPRNGRKRKLNDSSVKSRRSYKDLDASISISTTISTPVSIVKVSMPKETPKMSTPKVTPKTSTPKTSTPKTSTSNINKESEAPLTKTPTSIETPVIKTPELQKVSFPKVSGRKSLTRQVLEQNTIAKVLASPRMQTRLTMAKSTPLEKNAVGIEVTRSKTVTETSHTKITNKITGNVVEDSSSTKKEELKNVFTTETDPVTSEQTIKHSHNESVSKTSTKLTEINYESDVSNTSGMDPILTGNSDVDESFLVKYANNNVITNNESSIFTDSIEKDIQDFEESQEIEEIEAVEPVKETEVQETSVVVVTEEKTNENETKIEPIIPVVVDVCMEPQVFEITDDLTDEDVSFAIHNAMDVQITEASIELKEPESYVEPDFEEEVGNVLTEDSDIDVQVANVEGEQYEESSEDEDISGAIEPLSEAEKEDSNEENQESSSEKTSESDNQESDLEKEPEKIDTIEIEDSSNDKQSRNSESGRELQSDQEETDESSRELQIDEECDEEADEEQEEENSSPEQGMNEEDSKQEETSEEEKVSEESEDEKEGDDKSQKEKSDECVESEIVQSVEINTSSEEEMGELKIDQTVEEDESINVLEVNVTEGDLVFDDSQSKEIEEMNKDTESVGRKNQPVSSEEIIVVEKSKEPKEDSKIEDIVKEKRTRGRRASSLAPTTIPNNSRPKRRNSVDVELIVSSKPKIIQEELMETDLNEPKPSTSAVLPELQQEIIEETKAPEETEKKLPGKRGRKPSIQKEEIVDSPRRTTRAGSVQLEEQMETKPASPMPRRGRKPSVQDDEVVCSPKPMKISSVQLDEQMETNPTSPTPRRGRKPSVQDEIVDSPKRTRASSVQLEEQMETKPASPRRGRKPNIQDETVDSPKRTTRASSVQLEEQKTAESPKRRASSLQPEVKTPSRRGRKPSVQSEDTEEKLEEVKTPSRRGRKPSLLQEIIPEESAEQSTESDMQAEEIKTPSRRGRKRSILEETIQEEKDSPQRTKESSEEVKTPARRGRRPSLLEETIPEEKESTQSTKESSEEVKTPAIRGRKPSLLEETIPEIKDSSQSTKEASEEVKTPARRGRKPSLLEETVPDKKDLPQSTKETSEEVKTPVRRGRKPSLLEETIPEGKQLSKQTRARSLQPEDLASPRRGRKSSVPPEEKETELPTSARRSTRRTSLLEEEDKKTPGRRGKSTVSEDATPITPLRRGRRASASSEEIELKTPRRGRKSVDSESVTSKQSALEKIEEQIEEYAATHRLTRNQKTIMEKSIQIQERKKGSEVRGPKLGEIDPINLMDKESFTGEPDPEERPSSPTSSIRTESSIGTRSSARLASKHSPEQDISSLPSTPRRKRAAQSVSTPTKSQESPASETTSTLSEDMDDVTLSGRGKRRSFTLAQQALSTPNATKKRRISQESDGKSGTTRSSITSEATVILEQLDLVKEQQRSRTPSLSKGEDDETKSKLTRKTRTSILPKVELSNISEENTEKQESETKSTPARRGRPKKATDQS